MNPWQVVLTHPAERDLAKLPSKDQAAVSRSIDRLAADPSGVDMKKLAGKPDEWRLRVGDWRVRFAFDSETHAIFVLRVLPRGHAYRE